MCNHRSPSSKRSKVLQQNNHTREKESADQRALLFYLKGVNSLAKVQEQLVITADPRQPVAEINNIIGQFIARYPGSEAQILQAVRKSIDEALQKFDKKEEDATA
jgi:hypothetical protein